ncbi:cell division protein [Siphonobacter sp. BAB-5385]|uniref:Cell division protein FtsX n=1 Tax=Siphonobacter curvatus TaxID=2094562 RepID=A0A2S7IQW9_9BACT|nr:MULTISPECIES: ABC transporter permease [Siphonobacter]OZI05266.1 cell division protein [Siphonobacter sp. BAB-5385]PMD92824.1 cell division protein [Siphonobacter sp. BAB-5405]PQA60066.1 ABC transporter permease [Siphonobacter curvatus]
MATTQRRKKYLPNLTVTVSLTIALFLMGLCGLLTVMGRKLSEVVKQNIEVQVYLNKDLTNDQAEQIRRTIVAKPYVATREGKPQVTYVSKEEAAEKFIKDTGENFKDFLGENPLRDGVFIKIQEDYFSEAGLKQIKQDLQKIPGVFEATYVENFVEDVNKNITKIYLVLSVFVVLLLIIIVVLVNNTIKLALYSQRFTIRSMQLVGATNGFIRKPFLYRGIVQGLLSALFACGLLAVIVNLGFKYIDGIYLLLGDWKKLATLAVSLAFIGMLIGFISTFQSVERYLRSSIDRLY